MSWSFLMGRSITVVLCVLVASAAMVAIFVMFHEQPPSPAPASEPSGTVAVKPAQSPPIIPAEPAPVSSKTANPTSATTMPPITVTSTTQVTPASTVKPLQHIAALGAGDRVLRDRAMRSLIDKANADPDFIPKLLEELHAAFDSANSSGKLRIMFVAATVQGNVRQNIDDPKAPAAMLAGLYYLETHLNDPELANFAPQESFSHLALSKDDDGNWVWLLDDITANRGINLYFDETNTKIIRATTSP